MQKNIFETVLGAVVLLVAGVFIVFFYKTTDVHPTSGYEISAAFSKIDGLDTGSAVRISGVKVGQVLDFKLDPQTYRAIVRMNINNDVKVPKDSDAKISSEGLLGGKFMDLGPGGDEEMLKPGDQITMTQSSASLEDLLGRFIFSMNKDKEKDGAGKEESKEEGKVKPGAISADDHP